MKIFLLGSYLFISSFVIAQTSEQFSSIDDHKTLLARIQSNNDTLYVVNFWATWCKPCVAELPFLLTSADDMSGMPIKFLFVSLDFSNQIEKKLLPFIKARNIKEEVIALTDPISTVWIDAFSPEWDGAIPATFFYQNGILVYKEFGSFHSSEEINEIIKSL